MDQIRSARVGARWPLRPVDSWLTTLAALVLVTLSGTRPLALGDEPAGGGKPPKSAAELFRPDAVWSVHLRFTPEQWAAIEPPTRQNGPQGGMPPGPGMFLAPVVLKAGDADGDKALSAAEFGDLGARWFAAWDKEGTGTLKSKEVRDGLNSLLGPPPGTPAAPPRMSLQGPAGKRNGLSALMGIDFDYVHADLEFEGRTFRDVAIRYKGNGTFMESRGGPKRSFKVDLNKFVRGQKLAGVATLNLHNNVTDASLMNEALAYRLYRDSGVPAPRVGYARVFVTVPGAHDRRYFGLYSLVENVDKDFVADVVKAKGGALFKPVAPELFTDLGGRWEDYNQTYDPKTDPTPAQQARLIAFCKLVAHADDAAFAAKLGEFVDLDAAARYFAATTWLADLDGLLGSGQNFYAVLHPRTEKLVFIPWDQDHSFGQFPIRGTQEEREQLSIDHPWDGANRFLERLYRAPGFRERYRARFRELADGPGRPERLDTQVAAVAAVIRPAVAEESAERAKRFDQAVAGEPVAGAFGPGIVPIRGFAPRRARSVAAQLAGESAGLTLGSTAPRGGPPGDFSPGAFLGGLFFRELDRDRDGAIARAEFADGFAAWFAAWDADHAGRLTEALLRAGIDRDLAFARGGPPPAPGASPAGPQP